VSKPIILTLSECKIASVVWHLNWRNDKDIKRLAKKFWCGPYAYQLVCCEIGMAGGFITHDDLESIADAMNGDLDQLRKIIDAAAVIGLLDVSSHGITSRRVQREIERTVRMKLSKKLKPDSILVFPWSKLLDLGSEVPDPGSEGVDPGSAKADLPKQYNTKQSKGEESKAEQSKDPPQEATAHTVTPGDEKLLRFSEIDYEQLCVANGQSVVNLAISLAEAHIARKKGTPEYTALKDQARNGPAFIRSWALSKARIQLDEEEAAAARKTRAIAPPRDFEEERKRKREEGFKSVGKGPKR
jgi:hypothetical protein